jgi:hypothetical protein
MASTTTLLFHVHHIGREIGVEKSIELCQVNAGICSTGWCGKNSWMEVSIKHTIDKCLDVVGLLLGSEGTNQQYSINQMKVIGNKP